MNNENFILYAANCFRDSDPPCVSACPLGVDVRSLVGKIQAGNFSAAYRIYRQHVLFPDIVSRICAEPCRQACVRKRHDASVYLRKLEEACVALAKNRRPSAFQVPKKPYVVGIVGAGLSGLSCALKLASRNYGVRIYCRSEKPGGRLAEHLPENIYLPELEMQFSQLDHECWFSRPVADLDDIECDAIYVATGEGGDDFGLAQGLNPDSLATSREGVFLGGGIIGAGPLEAIEQGVRASASIETYLKVGATGDSSASPTSKPPNNGFYSLPLARAHPGFDADHPLDGDSAIAESARCLRCNCSRCRQNCEMMERFRCYPPKIANDIVASVNAIETLTERIAQRLVNSCTQCGVCKEVCPENVDMEECILRARRELYKNGSLPPAFHDYWLRDMDHANGEAGFLLLPEGVAKCAYLFFPGCQLGASDAAYVIETYDFLRGAYPDTALMQACCGVPADWAGNEELRDQVVASLREAWEAAGRPKLIAACPTCQKTLGRYFPESETLSLYEVLAGLWSQNVGALDEVVVYDSCSSRDVPAMSRGVRDLAGRAGLRWREVEGETPRCCGYGGNIYSANPKLVDAIVAKRIEVYGEEAEYLCYCANCRDTFARAGRSSRHILDYLFTGNPPDRPAPSLGQRRGNRMLVKEYFVGSGEGARDSDADGIGDIELILPPELVRKMDALLVLEDDVRRVIRHCEETGEMVVHSPGGLRTGHLRLGVITCWVKYRSEGANVYLLDNLYVHRMAIEENRI